MIGLLFVSYMLIDAFDGFSVLLIVTASLRPMVYLIRRLSQLGVPVR